MRATHAIIRRAPTSCARASARPRCVSSFRAGHRNTSNCPTAAARSLRSSCPVSHATSTCSRWSRTDHSLSAVRRLTIAEIGRQEATSLLGQCPNLAQLLCWGEIVTAAIQREWTINIGQRNAIEGVAQLMCEIFARQHGIPASGGGECDFLLTQWQLADATGLTQVHVNRTVQELRRRCSVELRNLRLYIPDFAELAGSPRSTRIICISTKPTWPSSQDARAVRRACGDRLRRVGDRRGTISYKCDQRGKIAKCSRHRLQSVESLCLSRRWWGNGTAHCEFRLAPGPLGPIGSWSQSLRAIVAFPAPLPL